MKERINSRIRFMKKKRVKWDDSKEKKIWNKGTRGS